MGKQYVIPSDFKVSEKVFRDLDIQQVGFLLAGALVGWFTFVLFSWLPFFIGYVLAAIPIIIGLIGIWRVEGRSMLTWGTLFIKARRRPRQYVWQNRPSRARSIGRRRVLGSKELQMEEVSEKE